MRLRSPARRDPMRGTVPVTQFKSLPAPVRGWIENENLSLNRGVGATVLENCFPLTDTVRVRKGALKVADIGDDPLEGFITYQAGEFLKFFACSDDDIYDISDLDPDDELTPVWTQTGGGRYTTLQIDTGGGQFVLAVNGITSMLAYDGTNLYPIADEAMSTLSYDGMITGFTVGGTLSGATSGATATIYGVIEETSTTGRLIVGAITSGPYQDNEVLTSASGSALANGASASFSSVTVTGVDTADLSFIWLYKNRVWGVEQGTMVAWYLPVDSVGGAAQDFNLGGVFKRGGSLSFGGTWSADSGEGFDDRQVFVSDQGEVAVYQGTDPDADDWGLVGVYDVGAPVTTQTMRAGGDLLIASTDGIVPISAITTKDPAALAVAAVSYPIQPAWLRVVKTRTTSSAPVQMLKWQRESMGIIGYPHRTGSLNEAHVVNLTTGAWSKWTGLDVQCAAIYRDLAYFGDSLGNVYQFEGAGSDDGAVYVARGALLPDHLDAPGAHKTVLMARATFRSLRPFSAKLSCAMDYLRTFPPAPNVYVITDNAAIWDSGLWDVAVWDDGDDSEQRVTATTRWRSIGRSGYSASPQWQIALGQTRLPDAELVQIDLAYQVGGTVV